MNKVIFLVLVACLALVPAYSEAKSYSSHLVGPESFDHQRHFASRVKFVSPEDEDDKVESPEAIRGDDLDNDDDDVVTDNIDLDDDDDDDDDDNVEADEDDEDEDDAPIISDDDEEDADGDSTYEEVLEACEAQIFNGTEASGNSTEEHHEEEECDRNDGFFAAWLVLYIFIIFLLFIGIAVVCDDFFVPSLEVISERLELSEDVAGATFMAAGSSAPELFTSVAGVGTESDVGVGTIVGSAVFNLLVIIAFTTLLAKEVLDIDWRPLVRDSVFYAFSIVAFIILSWDGKFLWWEALILLCLYILYIVTMKFNKSLMACMGGCAKSNEESAADGVTSFTSNGASSANVDEPKPEEEEEEEDEYCTLLPCLPRIKISYPEKPETCSFLGCVQFGGMWILFVLAYPWQVAYTWTIPDCSKEENKKWYLVSFTVAILWIALISWLMVECSEVVGCLLEIDSYTMGLVVIATGTSVPDALSSILVAREGYGNMAVSNAIGSNVFDINLGLGLPFLIGTLARQKPIHLLTPLQECLMANLPNALSMIPHVKFGLILLLILVLCLMIFAVVRFRLRKVIGLIFFIMYLMFLAYAFVQEKLCHGFTC